MDILNIFGIAMDDIVNKYLSRARMCRIVYIERLR